jgi:transposase
MFVRVKTVKSGSKEYQYYQLVEGVYKKGRVRQKVLMTLGRVDDFDRSKVDEIVSALEGYTDKVDVLSSIEDCHHVWSKEYGSVYVMEKLWHELKMDSILSGLLRDRQFEFDVQAAIRGMVINRAVNARSKLATYEWMDRDVYYSEREELELHHLYRALDFLISHKNAIENRIFSNLTDLFSMDVSVVFYDCSLVDMYGENSELVQHSRKGRQQFLLTLVMSRDGLPIGHEVLPGNMPDIKTVVDAMAKLKDRYSIGRCIFVGDRGMVSQEKLDQLKGLGYDYVVGVKRNQWKEVKEQVLATRGRFTKVKDNLYVKETLVNGKRYLICYNPYQAKKDKLTRETVVKQLEQEIKGLDPFTKKAAELYSHDYKGRFLRRLKDGSLRIDRAQVREDEKYDGKYVILTSEKELSKDEIALIYKQLSRIEQSFRSLKSLHDLAPVFHYRDDRIMAHAFLCVLSHLLERLMEKKLEASGLDMTARRALETLGAMKLTKVRLKEKEYLIRTDATPEIADIFKALHYQMPPRIQRISAE